MFIIKPLQYSLLVGQSCLVKNKLERVPEPHRITNQKSNVSDYNKAMDTVMVVFYTFVLDLIRRIAKSSNQSSALDLCCGPGHMTRLMAKHLEFKRVVGVDLSDPMLAVARGNAASENLTEKIRYIKSDVTSLVELNSGEFDLVTFMDGAHHMATLADVQKILTEAERVAKPSGTIILVDPIRPKSKKILERYHRVGGASYKEQGLENLYSDFYDSLYASWTTDELKTVTPSHSKRRWLQIAPFGFSSFQILVGLPEGRNELFVQEGLSKALTTNMIPKKFSADWRLLKFSFSLASIKQISEPKSRA